MTYEYKKLDVKSYTDSLYKDGFKKSDIHEEKKLENIILDIGIAKDGDSPPIRGQWRQKKTIS